ncbi:hypothetical protein EUAN_06820 [Andreesenia angusta]|uniref:DUF2313 domain-containing protein n=1 Tax=Andreesenia angusta TaxID=39480 RepID=A0A1S1V8H8_9FIRM|nr:putative phage tail protein [Andreesenia angusta]OHW62898.1 hypothetical protein EUAN_06820 [Andreesenia angusta]
MQNRLLSHLPKYERNSEIMKELFGATGEEFAILESEFENIKKQFAIDTATWALELYEKELALPVRPRKTLEERRAIIKAKMRGVGKISAALIKATVEAYTRSEVTMTFDGAIRIQGKNEDSISLNMEDICKSVEEIKPAHLGFKLKMLFSKRMHLYGAVAIRTKAEMKIHPNNGITTIARGCYLGLPIRKSSKTILIQSK